MVRFEWIPGGFHFSKTFSQFCFVDKYSEIFYIGGKETNIYKYNAGCRSTAVSIP